jgi:hypothetical protein
VHGVGDRLALIAMEWTQHAHRQRVATALHRERPVVLTFLDMP